MPDAIIFDVDGTLIDSVDFHATAWMDIFHRHGFDATFAEVRSQIGKGRDQLMPVFLPQAIVDRFGEQIAEERTRYFKEKFLPSVRPFFRVRELVERLVRDGKKVVFGSSGSKEEVSAYKQIAGVADLLDDETSADDAERSKPHPDIFLAAYETLKDIPKERVLVIGDTPYDAQAATKAGLPIIGVLCGGFPEADLRRDGCKAIFRDPEDLLARYDEWAN